MTLVDMADELRTSGLEPQMDLICHNQDQDRALARLDTVEIDSLIERIGSMRAVPAPGRDGFYLVPGAVIDAAENDVWFCVESNGREGRLGRTVAGRLESFASRLYFASGIAPHGYRRVARRLRRALDALAELADASCPNPTAREIALARQVLADAVRELPAETLHNDQLHRDLGRAKSAILLDYLSTKEGAQ